MKLTPKITKRPRSLDSFTSVNSENVAEYLAAVDRWLGEDGDDDRLDSVSTEFSERDASPDSRPAYGTLPSNTVPFTVEESGGDNFPKNCA